jgi:hypothetical protein
VVFDTLARLIRHEFGPDSLTYARNVTDVDDKIIAAAEAEGVEPHVITERYERFYLEDMGALGVEPPTIAPHATQEIGARIIFVRAAPILRQVGDYSARVPGSPGRAGRGRCTVRKRFCIRDATQLQSGYCRPLADPLSPITCSCERFVFAKRVFVPAGCERKIRHKASRCAGRDARRDRAADHKPCLLQPAFVDGVRRVAEKTIINGRRSNGSGCAGENKEESDHARRWD